MLQLAAQRLAETLDTFNQQNLALTLWAYARFSFGPSTPIMVACAERATALAVVRCPAAFTAFAYVLVAVSWSHWLIGCTVDLVSPETI